MTTAEKALQAFARAHGLRVSACNHHNANLGEPSFRQTRLWKRDCRITLRAAITLIDFELRLTDRAIPPFSVNHPDRIFALRHHARLLDAVIPWPVFTRSEDMAAVTQWFHGENHAQLVLALALGVREALQVYVNGVTAIVEPSRDLIQFVDLLVALGHELPAAPAEKVDLRALSAELPKDLQALGRFFARWAIADDEERSDRIARARSTQRAQLRRAVEPLLPRIGAYLASLPEPLPESALRLGYLAELVAELRASEA